MKGRGDHLQNKWGSINNVMKRRQIAVLGLQETHPSDEMQETIGRRFRNALHIVHSADPDDPSTTGGVSVAIQKSMVDAKGITHRIVIPGRAILVEIPWNGSKRLRVLNIYAPARNANKAEFWERLLSDINNDETLRPDVIMGDFNLVENPEIDRLNNRRGTDPTAARNAMTELTTELNMADGWRRRHPGKRGYTFIGSSQSRLDRIYTREDIYPWCTDWKIEHPSFETDHSLVSVQMTSENMPYIGRGRWAIPVNLLRNRQMKKGTQELARKLQADVERTIPTDRTTGDPQLALKTFKASIIELYRSYQRTNQPRLENAIRSLRKELENKADTPDLTVDEIQEQSTIITERINALEKKRRDEARLLSSARNRLEGETMSKHWVRSAKEAAPQDTI